MPLAQNFNATSKAILSSGFFNLILLTPRRYRFKKKWATHYAPSTNCLLALKNFDAFYKPYFGVKWPSIRLALLSLPKYCAAVNKYGDWAEATVELEDLGADDFIHRAQLKQDHLFQLSNKMKPEAQSKNFIESNVKSSDQDEFEQSIERSPNKGLESDNSSQNSDDSLSQLEQDELVIDEAYSEELDVFLPAERVYTDREKLLMEEIGQNTFDPRNVAIDILPPEQPRISKSLNVFAFPKSDISSFPSPKSRHGVLGYYLMDASSVLPVLALEIQPEDQVLDLCAAPGGKSFLISQSLDFYSGGFLHCNEPSQSRLTRLKNVLKSHLPHDIASKVSITKRDGTTPMPPIYNKVLVDVPCNSDRHVVNEDDNNLFKPSRTRERLGLMELQKELLVSAIKSSTEDGTVVYSTCTLSPAQNDGVIQAAVEELSETTDIEIAVQDLSLLSQLLHETFQFHTQTKYGLLVVPSLLNNFGPSYCAKLKRIR